ncbi:ABC transporter permease [Lutibacter sp. A80]|uniref:ABC transporter permease n=1 Tax=Lutibacter sp. A80 TaxID=2918453 RepID=UPI001F068EE0|nr:ABC transporter permease [Lutibacter sp. A80]UMB60769.1 ABC transporter permease [Lutibacter sp. A80]
MRVWNISLQNIKAKPLYTFLSILILTLSIALLLGIKQLETSFKYQMEANVRDIDLVVGAKGSPLQLVLASVLHIDNPTGNIIYNDAKKIAKSPFVKTAVPISYGDNYKGYRIVGTTDEFMTLYNAELEEGRKVKKSMEVVLGSNVAKQLGLKVGSVFLSSHGLVENEIHVHTDELTVVGILKPTQKVIDRLIVTNLKSVWDVHHHEDGHEHEENHVEHHEDEHEHNENLEGHQNDSHEHEENHVEHHEDSHEHGESHIEHQENYEEGKEITSLLITFRSPTAFLTFPRSINENTNMQAALPKVELDKLYAYTGVGFKTISGIAYIILVISCIIIFISLYKMVKERAFDLALLRTYGASNVQLIKMVTYEGVLIGLFALFLGFLMSKVAVYFMFRILEDDIKYNLLQVLSFHDFLQIVMLVLIMILVSVMLAIYPIIKMNISTILSNEK